MTLYAVSHPVITIKEPERRGGWGYAARRGTAQPRALLMHLGVSAQSPATVCHGGGVDFSDEDVAFVKRIEELRGSRFAARPEGDERSSQERAAGVKIKPLEGGKCHPLLGVQGTVGGSRGGGCTLLHSCPFSVHDA
jgi:hypothetical protein